MVIVLNGIVCADPGVNATPETQTLSTATSADVMGIVMETDAGTWTLTNSGSALHTLVNPGDAETMRPPSENLEQVLAAGGNYILLPTDPGVVISLSIPESLLDQQRADGSGHTWREFIAQSITLGWIYSASQGGIHTGALDPGQVQYTTAYDAHIVAQGGKTSFIKQMTIDTRNKVTSQSNLKAQTGLTFAATSDGGNVVGSENLMLDGAGDTIDASDRMLCPFISQPDPYIPTFCNIIQAGSKYDLTIGSVTTNVDERFVGTDATDPVVMNYAINIKPYSTIHGPVPCKRFRNGLY